jgi:hypothetical protein
MLACMDATLTSSMCVCEHCGAEFERRSRFGRAPRYCKASHRVRACERRRGLLRAGRRPNRTHLPAPLHYTGPQQGHELTHQLGRSQHLTHWRTHFVRPGALPDEQGRIASICGTMLRHPGERPYGVGVGCKRCNQLAPLHPVNESWWAARTQHGATALLADMSSLVLAVRQALDEKRDPSEVLERVEHELSMLVIAVGLDAIPAPSLHPRSCAA